MHFKKLKDGRKKLDKIKKKQNRLCLKDFLSSNQTSITVKLDADSGEPISRSKTNDFVELSCHSGRGNSPDSHKTKKSQ